MIRERAVVDSVGDGIVLIRPISPANCPRCAEGRGCGGSVLLRLMSGRRDGLRVASRVDDLRRGDHVIVGVDESALVQASLLLWLAPLLGMLLAGAFAARLLQAADILVAAFGLAGLAGGFLWVRWRVERIDPQRFRPVVLCREDRLRSVCPRLQ